MSRLLVVSRIVPGAQGRVAQIFAEADATELPTSPAFGTGRCTTCTTCASI